MLENNVNVDAVHEEEEDEECVEWKIKRRVGVARNDRPAN